VFKLDETSADGLPVTLSELSRLPRLLDETRLARSTYLRAQVPESFDAATWDTSKPAVPDFVRLDESEETEGYLVSDEIMQRLTIDGDVALI